MNFDLKPIIHKPKPRAPSKNMSCKEIVKRILKVMEQLPDNYFNNFYIGFNRIHKNVFYMNNKKDCLKYEYGILIRKDNKCYRISCSLNYYDLKRLVED